MLEFKENILILKRKSKGLTNVLKIWFFVTILPQMLLLTREDSGNLTIKIALLGFLIMLTFYYVLKNPIRFNIMNVLGWIWFVLIQLISNIVIKPYVVENSIGVYINIFLSTLYILFFLVMFDKFTLSLNDVKKFCKFFIAIVMYACLYNIICNYNVLGKVFSVTSTYQYSLSSFFSNRNTFAIFLSFGMAACFILHDTKKSNNEFNWLTNLCFMLISLNLFLTNARTSIFSVIIYVLFRYYLINKKKFLSFTIKVLVVLIAVITIAWSIGLHNYIIDIVIRPQSGFTKRDVIWKAGLDLFWNNNIIFGSGEAYSRFHISMVTGNTGFHNTYISMLNFGGIFLLTFYLILIKKSFSKCKAIIKYDKRIGINLMSVILMYLASSMAETNILFYSSTLNVIGTIFVVLLPKYYYNYLKSGGTKVGLLE